MIEYKISFIVPVYNSEEYLCTCVDSLLNQSYQNFEVIMVDDGSTDNSSNICDAYEGKDNRVKTIHKKNGGLISSWICGTTESTGDYLCYVDSDDWIDAHMLSEMTLYLSGNSQEIVSSDYVIERSTGEKQYVYQKLEPGEYGREKIEKNVIPYLLGQEHRYVCLSRCMKLISRSLIADNMHFCNPAIRTGEDTTIMLPALLDCKRLFVMDHKAYYHYRYVKQSMIHQYDHNLYKNNRNLKDIIYQILNEKMSGSIPDDMRINAEKEYMLLLLLVIKNEVRGNEKCRVNIQRICKEKEVKEIVKRTSIEFSDLSNKLLYLVLKHPNYFIITITMMAMKVYYLRKPV